ncbi:hypothetical protein ARMSODRAFT_956033 [Armillaria solidipes]|uniref:Uncharacterized protein n=1 Tax=Armillaria solidipes TaxID=1076256 RepID=A0A2H3C339_9AGAR|nr:hypothetical protein ARMSODRAFT_956033 [Armillaria solidipes]
MSSGKLSQALLFLDIQLHGVQSAASGEKSRATRYGAPLQLGLVDSELCDLPQFHVDTTTRYRVDGTNPAFCDLAEYLYADVTPGGRD